MSVKVDEQVLLESLTGVFRRQGYAGASIADISDAVGLQKSSLYHRFPGGKEQMAAEVAVAVGEHVATSVLAPLAGDGAPHERVRAVARNLARFYDGGSQNCLLDVLSLAGAGPDVAARLTAAADAWTDAFAAVAREAGADRPTAIARAQDAIAAIEGALVLARVTGDRRPFRRALDRLPDILVAPPGDSHTKEHR